MGLVTVDNDEVYAISVSQSPGMIAPAINARILPHLADVMDETNLSYVAPDLSVNIGGVTYDCAADEVSLELEPESVGFDIEVQYYPKALRTLRHGGLKKSLVFISCRPYQRDLLKDEYDTDRFEVLFKECDVYVSDGWTLAEILQEIASRAEVTIQCLLPPFHVPNTTVVFQRGQKFLDFIRSLLPQGFEYSWNLQSDDTLSISLVQSAHEENIAFVPGMFRMAVASQSLPAYDFIEITGGEYKYGQTFDMGDAEWGCSVSYPDGRLLTKTLPQETHATDEGTETVDVGIQYRTGPDGQEMFALLERTTIVTGPYPNTFGTFITTQLRKTIETYTYGNDDPSIYRTPRKTQVDTTVSQHYTKLAAATLTGAQVFYLTDDLRVVSAAEYATLDPAPGVLLAAYQVYGATETSTETWEYITEDTADWNWHEGMQRSNIVSVTHKFCEVNSLYYDAHLSPKELLQAVLTDMTTQGTDEVDTYSSDIDKEGSVVSRTISFLHSDAYQYEEATKLFDVKAGGMMTQPLLRQVLDTNRVPSSPSNYRTAPMRITLDTLDGSSNPRRWGNGLGGNEVCFSRFAQVLTNNPIDFKAWAGALIEQILYVPRNVSMSSFDRMYRVGSIVGGVTITSFQVSESEGEQSVVLGGLA